MLLGEEGVGGRSQKQTNGNWNSTGWMEATRWTEAMFGQTPRKLSGRADDSCLRVSSVTGNFLLHVHAAETPTCVPERHVLGCPWPHPIVTVTSAVPQASTLMLPCSGEEGGLEDEQHKSPSH